MINLLKKNIESIIALCEKHHVQRLYVFGSAVNGNFTLTSDIDILVCFRENLSIKEYSNDFFELRRALHQLLKKNVDLLTEHSLSNPYLIKGINDTKQLIYEFKNKKITI